MGRLEQPLTCSHCGTEIQGNRYVEKESGVYLGLECYFRDTYLDGIVSGIESTYLATIEAFVTAVDAREHETGDHLFRVSRLAVILGHALGLKGQELADLYTGAILHDLGKIGVRESVLNKEGPLTPEEYDHVKEHVVIGSQILAPLSHLGPIVEFVRGHHEHYDGSGYPDQLKGDDIPLGARIICAAEIYDALTTARPYQPMMTPEQAVERMRRLAGSVVDPGVMDAIAAAVAKRQTLVFIDEDPTKA